MPETILNKNISEFWTPERCFIQEILNDPSHPNSSLAVARVPPGVTTQLHRLNGTEETYIIKRGDGVLEIDGEKSELQLGDAIIIPAGASQKISNIADKNGGKIPPHSNTFFQNSANIRNKELAAKKQSPPVSKRSNLVLKLKKSPERSEEGSLTSMNQYHKNLSISIKSNILTEVNRTIELR